jgi:hypothetical protein
VIPGFSSFQWKRDVLYIVDPTTTLDPNLIGHGKTENKTKTYVKCSKSPYNNTKHPNRGLTRENPSVSNGGRLSLVWEDVVGKDELWWDLPDHSEHRIVLLIFVSKLLPQLLLKLNLIEALVILGCMNLS